MKLRQILEIMYRLHKQQPKISEPFICGGIVRDKLIGQAKEKYSDLDITTCDASVRYLAEEFALLLSKKFDIEKKVAPDGHVSVNLDNLKVDFSSNFVVPDILNQLSRRGIKNPSSLQKEMFSRDFTCNSLLLNFNLRDILDPTEMGIRDINDKLVRTCLDPNSTFSNNIQRIPRVYYVAAKLGFEVDPEIIKWIKMNSHYFEKVDPKYVYEKVSKAMSFDHQITSKLLDLTDGWKFVKGIK